MSDIVKRLFNVYESNLSPLGPSLADWVKETALQSVTEIERLRAELEQERTAHSTTEDGVAFPRTAPRWIAG